MNFADLTWNQDAWNEEQEVHMGWQAQYEAPNGYLLIVNTQLNDDYTVQASATEAGLTYSCSIYSWDRAENSDPISTENDCTNNRVDSIIDEVEALTLPEVEETTTTTTAAPGPSGQWD